MSGLPAVPGVGSFEIAGNGYINVRLDRLRYASSLLRQPMPVRTKVDGKIIVEHTNINPNKAAHIGHLRNAILGDTFVRMLRARRQHRRSAELYRQHRRASGRCGGRVSLSREEDAAEVEGTDRRPRDSLRLPLLGSVRAHLGVLQRTSGALAWRSETLHAIEAGKRRTGRDGASGGRRHRADCTLQPCAGWASSTTCCRARARSCTCSSGPPRFELLKERKAHLLRRPRARTRAAG